MKQSRGVRRSPRSKQDKLSSRSTPRRETISEKFQIGFGKYVHDVQFSQSIVTNGIERNVEIDRFENNECTSDKSCCSGDNSESISSERDISVRQKNNSAKDR